MHHTFGELSAQRRRLGAALRRLRADAGLSGEQIATRLGISQSKVSRLELGQQTASVAVVERWARVCEASADFREELVEWAESAAVEAVAWRKALGRGLAAIQQDVLEVEASSGLILSFAPLLVPGLLQVPEYSRRIYMAGDPEGRPDIGAAVAARMDRQTTLYSESKRFEFVIAEAALRWRVGPPNVMLAQVDRIDSVVGLPSVTVGLIPLEAEVAVWHEHSFTILDDRGEGDPLVHVETMTRGLNITEPDEVARYRDTFNRLRATSVVGEDAAGLLRQIRETFLR